MYTKATCQPLQPAKAEILDKQGIEVGHFAPTSTMAETSKRYHTVLRPQALRSSKRKKSLKDTPIFDTSADNEQLIKFHNTHLQYARNVRCERKVKNFELSLHTCHDLLQIAWKEDFKEYLSCLNTARLYIELRKRSSQKGII